ncbi:hypothetical protein V6Z12_A07G143300 [Gossypium hirsutum]
MSCVFRQARGMVKIRFDCSSSNKLQITYLFQPSNQGSFQMFTLFALPIRQTSPSAISSRALHILL